MFNFSFLETFATDPIISDAPRMFVVPIISNAPRMFVVKNKFCHLFSVCLPFCHI